MDENARSLKRDILEGCMQNDGLDPVTRKWMLKFEEVLTDVKGQVAGIQEELEDIRAHIVARQQEELQS